ncbi:hypothetical protein BH24ACT15_BH24ACT15_36950 [soil metagenome]
MLADPSEHLGPITGVEVDQEPRQVLLVADPQRVLRCHHVPPSLRAASTASRNGDQARRKATSASVPGPVIS